MVPLLRLTLQNTLVLPLATCPTLRRTGKKWCLPCASPGESRDPQKTLLGEGRKSTFVDTSHSKSHSDVAPRSQIVDF